MAALDPDGLSEEESDGLLAATGLLLSGAGAEAPPGGGLELPERMAEVNAPLDLAPPKLREAVLVAFLDRLQRPPGRLKGWWGAGEGRGARLPKCRRRLAVCVT